MLCSRGLIGRSNPIWLGCGKPIHGNLIGNPGSVIQSPAQRCGTREGGALLGLKGRQICSGTGRNLRLKAFPFDLAWAPSLDAESIAPQLFAFSIIPYAGFLYYMTKSKATPPLALFGFYFLLVFVGVSIPAGIYAKIHYGQSLANVDWLHGGAETFLTITNLLIVIGMRQGIREAQQAQDEAAEDVVSEVSEPESAIASD